MTSREDIALQLTLANAEKIALLNHRNDAEYTNETLAINVNNFYNYIFNNIKTSDNNYIEPIDQLKS